MSQMPVATTLKLVYVPTNGNPVLPCQANAILELQYRLRGIVTISNHSWYKFVLVQ